MIPYGRQDISQGDIEAVVEVLRSDFLTQGPATERFEQAVATYCGAGYAVAVNSATSALHLACLALGLGPGDWLWTSPNTFVASANCALHCGAKVDFVDIDPRTYNLSVAALREKLERAERDGRLPKVVIPVHFAGQACAVREIGALSDLYGFRIIEDASHAVGGRYLGELVGNNRYSDITVFSFHPVKIITTGEGGMALTNSPDLAEKLRLLRTHGITRNPDQMRAESQGPWYYEQIELGFNFRMTDIQAALGYSQLQQLNEFVARRRDLADRYDSLLSGFPVVTPWRDSDAESAFHLYVIRLDERRVNRSRREVFEEMRRRGIAVNVHYIPVHTQPYYQALGFIAGEYPEAEHYYREAITLPLFPSLTESQQDSIVANLREIVA